jgi:8-oxo-dGTP diphosphatase
MVWNEESVLLVRRGNEPLKGLWSFPGGLVEAGETLAEAAAREALEETAIVVGNLAPIDQSEIIRRDAEGRLMYHYVLVVFSGTYGSGAVQAGDDAEDARWVTKTEVAGLPLTDDTKRLVHTHGPGLAEYR